jgi:hypothetical protein
MKLIEKKEQAYKSTYNILALNEEKLNLILYCVALVFWLGFQYATIKLTR